jgi:hypothetical protein
MMAKFEAGIPWKDAVDFWQEVEADSARQAAKLYSDRSDSGGDYTLIKNGGGEVWVRDEGGVVTKWEIVTEMVPVYYAFEKETGPERRDVDG